MRGVGRDIGVAQRRRQAFLRDRRIVVAVNQIMGDARMIGMPGELRLEDRRRLHGPRIALVGRRLSGGEVQRAEDLRLVVVAVAVGQSFEGVGQRLHARPRQPLAEMIVIGANRLDIVALALGLGADGPAALDCGESTLRLFRDRADGEGVADKHGRNSPGGDGTGRVVGKRLAERLLAGDEREGMEQRDAALETFLGLRRARIGKGDRSEPFRRSGIVMRPRGLRRPQQCKQQKTDERATGHGGLHSFCEVTTRRASGHFAGFRGSSVLAFISADNAAAICLLPPSLVIALASLPSGSMR